MILTKNYLRLIIIIVPFYNSFIDVPKIKNLSKVQLMKELPFYDELKITKIKMHLVVMQELVKLKLLIKQTWYFN